MKPGLLFLLISVFMPGGFDDARAQTLTEKLQAEDPARLASEAREKGDIIRGAILFHQGEINCAKCHRATSEKDRFGPDLGNLNPEKPDAFIIDSILKPSQEIKEGFETIVAATTDGKVFYGLVVDNDSQKIVLRDNSNIDQLVTVEKEDLDELQIGRKSSMPEGLADQLKNRQQFLDLVRYVIDVKKRGMQDDLKIFRSKGQRKLGPELEARILLHENQCGACHTGASIEGISAARPPALKWSAAWINPDYLQSYIADPFGTKPGTRMPQTMLHLDEKARKEAAEAITHFLIASVTPSFKFQSLDMEAAQRGNELFHSVGCVACHAPRNKDAEEQPLGESLPLGDLTPKYNVDGLVEFLEAPLAVRPGGRMPNMQLDHHEAVDIANFLLQKTVVDNVPWTIDQALAEKGKTLFTEIGCHGCHEDPAGRSFKPEARLNINGIAGLRRNEGCMKKADDADTRTRFAPQFQLTDEERALLDKFLQDPVERILGPRERIDVTLRAFNCIACHERGDVGGVTALRNPHFQTTNLNLGDQGRIPPTLTNVGAKLKPDWMRDVLVKGRSIRPYMKTRMPQYGETNVGHLVEAIQRTDHITADVDIAEFEDQKKMRELGLHLAGNQGLNCVACHTYQYKLSDTMPAVDLTEMADRLKKDWFYEYMLHPQRFSPNTVMPSFWPGGTAIRHDLEGNPEFQIEALWQYLLDGRQAPMPRGVVRVPMEIVVTDDAQMLRRQYPGIGKRGIGVGYPGGVNLAFDAEQMRLGLIWRGKFVDPVGAWTGQGSGNVRPLGNPIEFAKGPDLDDAADPWIVDEGRPPDHQFLGYSLNDQQQPTFRYRFDEVQVQDFFVPFEDLATNQTQLRRTITLRSEAGRDQTRFRIATGESITAEEDGTCTADNRMKIRVVSEQPASIVDDNDNRKHVQVVLELKAGRTQQLVIEYLLK